MIYLDYPLKSIMHDNSEGWVYFGYK